MAEITKIDPNFNKDNFLRECEREIVPTVLEASLKSLNCIFVLLCFKPCYISLRADNTQGKGIVSVKPLNVAYYMSQQFISIAGSMVRST